MSRERPRYRDRDHAGALLAEELLRFACRPDVVVLALPRGGVPVAWPVTQRLAAPLDVLVVRKLGVPGRPELAMGAVASVGGRVELMRNESVIASARVTEDAFDAAARREHDELERRLRGFDGSRTSVEAQVVIVVDDGLATGSTMLAAVRALRSQGPAEVVVAVPVAASQAIALLRDEADEVVCPHVPPHFAAVGLAYADFTQVPEGEVHRLLSRSFPRSRAANDPPSPPR